VKKKLHLSKAKNMLSRGIVTQETPQCDETRFSTIQPSIDMTGIRNEDGSEEKMMPLFWLHWLHAPSWVSIG